MLRMFFWSVTTRSGGVTAEESALQQKVAALESSLATLHEERAHESEELKIERDKIKSERQRAEFLLQTLRDNMQCSITQDFPNEPIYCKVDKHLYEGPNIRQWVKKHSVSPLTRETVLESDLVSVDPLKAVLPVLETTLMLLSVPATSWSVSVSELQALRSAEWDGRDEDGKGAVERTSYPSLCSPELSFSQMEFASERFAFKLLIFPNGKDAESTGALGVYFVPRLGAEKAAAKLRWPIRKQVSIAIMDGDRKLKHLRMDPIGGADDERAFFLEHAPPSPGNRVGRGWRTFLRPQEAEHALTEGAAGKELTFEVRLLAG